MNNLEDFKEKVSAIQNKLDISKCLGDDIIKSIGSLCEPLRKLIGNDREQAEQSVITINNIEQFMDVIADEIPINVIFQHCRIH